jgi:hypothetical protein
MKNGKKMVSFKSTIIKWTTNPLVVALIIFILTAIFAYGIIQPNIKYEKDPIIITNAPVMKCVHCVLLKNIGYSTAEDVIFEIKSDFFQDYNEIMPEIWRDYCMINLSDDRYRTTYTFDKFADGTSVMISIPAPSKDSEIKIGGMHDGGKEIMENGSTLKGALIIGVCSYILGLLTCLAVFKFYLGRKKIVE